jgi:hypothetical protein
MHNPYCIIISQLKHIEWDHAYRSNLYILRLWDNCASRAGPIKRPRGPAPQPQDFFQKKKKILKKLKFYP